jgi:hypothetical protein
VKRKVPFAAKYVADGTGKPTRIYRITSTVHIKYVKVVK